MESTKRGTSWKFLLRRALKLLLKWRTPLFYQKGWFSSYYFSGEFSKREARLEFLLRGANHMIWAGRQDQQGLDSSKC